MFHAIEQRLGLHQEIRIIYVVDGYEAELYDEDGQRFVVSEKGETFETSLHALEARLRILGA